MSENNTQNEILTFDQFKESCDVTNCFTCVYMPKRAEKCYELYLQFKEGIKPEITENKAKPHILAIGYGGLHCIPVTYKPKFYGVYNNKKKEFQFGICETSINKAEKALFNKIGKDAYKWRFEIKELKEGNPKAMKLLYKAYKERNIKSEIIENYMRNRSNN